MKKLILILLTLITVSAAAQKQPYQPFRSNGTVMVKDSALAVGQFLIPTYTTFSLGAYADRWGQSFGLNRTTNALNVRGNSATLEYRDKTYNDATYSTPASVLVQIVANPPTLQAVTGSGATTTLNIQANRLTAGKTNSGETMESNGSVVAFGSIAAHGAAKASLGYSASVLQLWSHGANSSTPGGFQFLSRSSDGGNATTPFIVLGNGRIGAGVTAPEAAIHLRAGTSSALGAPLKFTTGTNLATPENGTIEYNGTNFFGTPSATTRKKFAFLEDLSIVNTTTSALSVATLNSTYPGVPVGYRVICHLITGAPTIYTKATENGNSDVWLTTTAIVTP